VALGDLNLVVSAQVSGATQGLKQVDQSLQRVQGSMARANQATRAMTNQFNSSRSGLQRFATGAMQQAGYQVGDFAVQVANGTSKMQAFGQQGSQLLGIFGPWGAILGAGVAIVSAFGVAAQKSGKSLFDMKKFTEDLAPTLEKLSPILNLIGGGFTRLKEVSISAINLIINGFQYFVASVAAIPDAFRVGLEKAGLYLNSFVLDAQSASYSVQSAVQGMMDALVPGDPKAGFLGMLDDETGYTAAENFAFMARSVKSQAQNMRAVAADTAGVFDTLGNAMKNVTAIDIRDYFGAAAEAVAGDGVDGSPSLTNALTEAQERMKSIADTMKDAFTSGFMSIIDGTKSAKDAFRDMARSIIAKLYEVLVVQRLVGSFDAATGTGTGLVGMIMGAFGGFRANGGPVSGGTPYIVGERGPELFVPSRSGTIVPNGAGGGVTVNQNISFGAGVSRAEIQSMLPRIVETTKAAVFDAQRRSVNGLGYA
jgi:hypothetical protein